MNQRLQQESGFLRRLSYPLLLECDTTGNVIWMSERTRLALGSAIRLMNTLPWESPSANPETTGKGAAPHVTRLWESAGRVVVGIGESKEGSEPEGLLRVQVSLLRHYIRLEAIEKNLSRRVRERRRAPISRVRQIELERQRLATELHTSVGQLLSAIRMQLEVITSQVTSPVPNVQQALNRISTLSAEALELVRSISKRLHPPEWQRLPLPSAIRQVWELSGIPQRFDSHLTIEAIEEPDLDAKVLLYRAAQEAVSNITRHSRATRVTAVLATRGDRIFLRFEDDGMGFDAARLLAGPASLAAGIGLRTIREQAEELGGTLYLESAPGSTKLEVSVPLRTSNVEPDHQKER